MKRSQTVDKTRSWSLIVYLPVNVLQDTLDYLCAFGTLLHYAYIFHDKDIDGSGTLKPPHIHLVVYFKNPCRPTTLQEHFTDVSLNAGNCLFEPLADRYKMVYDYFIHKSEPDKYQYPFSDVISDNLDFWQSSSIPAEDVSILIVEKMLAKVPYIDIVREFGRNFVYHYSAFKSLVEDIQSQNWHSEVQKNIKSSLVQEKIDFFDKKS